MFIFIVRKLVITFQNIFIALSIKIFKLLCQNNSKSVFLN